MGKKVAIGLLLVLILAIPVAVAQAEDGGVQARILQLRSQIRELRQQLVREQLGAGLITEEQAARRLARLDTDPAQRAELAAAHQAAHRERVRQIIGERLAAGLITEEHAARCLEMLEVAPEVRAELAAAHREAQLEQMRQLLAEKVAAGLITQEQADLMLQRMQAGGGLPGGRGRGPCPRPFWRGIPPGNGSD
ncbi:MAG: hypothetical protein RDU89_00085 [bacterium]|nr:hypothetical protein [bacterium]